MSNCIGVSFNIDSAIKVKKVEDLIELPKIVLVNAFDELSAKNFRKDFMDAVNTGQKIVPIVIDSYGGQVYSLLSMIDQIKSSPIPVATICTGKAMSCGAILLTCGTEGHRYVGRHSTTLIHDVSAGAFGKVLDIDVKNEEIQRLNQKIYHIMAENVGKPKNYFLDIVHEKGHADWYLTPEDCIQHNIANHIGTPSFKVKVETSITFE